MSSELSVLVEVDLDGRGVTLRVAAGALTVVSQQGLHALIRRARTLTPGIAFTVDLTALAQIDASAVRLLRQALQDPGLTGRGGVVRLVAPVTAGTTTAHRAGDFSGGAGPAAGMGSSGPVGSSTQAGTVAA